MKKKNIKKKESSLNGVILVVLGVSLFSGLCMYGRWSIDQTWVKACNVERDATQKALKDAQLDVAAADRDLGNSAQEFKTLREEIAIWQKRYTLLSIQHQRALKGIDQQQCRIQELTDGHKHSCDDEGNEPW